MNDLNLGKNKERLRQLWKRGKKGGERAGCIGGTDEKTD